MNEKKRYFVLIINVIDLIIYILEIDSNTEI